jgi:hypothetical protein
MEKVASVPTRLSLGVRPPALLAVALALSFGSVAVLAASPSPGPARSGAPVQAPLSATPSDQALPASQAAAPTTSASGEPAAKPSAAAKPAEKPDTETEHNSASDAAHAIDRLAAADIRTTPDVFQKIAATVGVGGAVRVLAFADASGQTPDQILAMFQGGLDWGQISKNLHLSIGPGIGWIMGQGHGNAEGHSKPEKPSKP